MPDYIRIQGDTGRPIKDTLETDGDADDLAGATVVFTLWRSGGPTVVDENESNVTVEDAGAGQVRYDFAAGDLATVGVHYFEWEVTFSDGTVVTYRQSDGTPKEVRVLAEGS